MLRFLARSRRDAGTRRRPVASMRGSAARKYTVSTMITSSAPTTESAALPAPNTPPTTSKLIRPLVPLRFDLK